PIDLVPRPVGAPPWARCFSIRCTTGTRPRRSVTSPMPGRCGQSIVPSYARMPMIQSLYLAGPDIFRPDAVARGEQLKALCARYGFEGLFPLDAQVAGHAAGDPHDTARWIYRADIGLLDAADAVLANL